MREGKTPDGVDEEAGDPLAGESPEAFCRRFSPRLLGALIAHCGDRDLAEDLAQEALALAWERWDEVASTRSPAGWTYGVAVNLARTRRRRLGAEVRALGRSVSSARTGAVSTDSEDEVGVLDAVRRLPERQHATIIARYYLRLSVAETADALGCAAGTVKSNTSQAITELRRVMDVHLPTDEET